MTIIIFMIIIVISIFFFRVLFIFVFLMFMVMIVSGEDVIAWDNVGVQVQEEIGSWCSIYSLCQEQKRTFHTHTPHTPPPRPSPHPPSRNRWCEQTVACYKLAVCRAARETCGTQVRQSYKWKLFRVASETFAWRSPEQARECWVSSVGYTYVQGAVLQMTGDEGAVLLCAEEHENFCPLPPPPTKP